MKYFKNKIRSKNKDISQIFTKKYYNMNAWNQIWWIKSNYNMTNQKEFFQLKNKNKARRNKEGQ